MLRKCFYPFLEAMEVVQRMGIKSFAEYRRRYKEDPRLPSSPNRTYASEWVSWLHFFGKECFHPFLEAMEVVQRMGIKSFDEYKRRYKEDPRLPSHPNLFYASDWINWPHFLGKEGFYPFPEAMEVVQRMGIEDVRDYKRRYKEDPRLPSTPESVYVSEWRGWPHFLGRNGFYPFPEAMEVVQRMGIKSWDEYRRRYKEDPRLPSSPNRTYASEWKGLPHFLGNTSRRSKPREGFYPFPEAMEVVQRMGIKSFDEYKCRYKEDPRLPSAPNATYASEWISWSHFLGKTN